MKRHILMLLAIGMALNAWAQKTFTVSKDGSGDYTTVQAAVDAVAEGETATIMVKAGTYEGMVKVGLRTKPSTKCISLIGTGHLYSEHRWKNRRTSSCLAYGW